MITGVKSLAKIKFVIKLIVGIPPKTEKRKVIDNSYAVSKLIFFKSIEYQKLIRNARYTKNLQKNVDILWAKRLFMIQNQ